TGKAASGGSATSISTAINDAGEARANYSGSYDAQGGSGGLGRNGADGGDGGAASRTATATTQGDYYARTYGYAWGGSGGNLTGATGGTAGTGGDAIDTTTVTSTGNGTIDGNSVGASGGNGGYVSSGTGSGGAGGAATATATGSNAGTASVTVGTTSTGGTGGYGRGAGESGGAGGVGTIVSATGSSTGGASVSVTATQVGGAGGDGYDGADGGDGADSDLVDVVTGATSGNLTLTQTATGGAAGDNRGAVGGSVGAAGNATSSLSASNSDGGNVTGNSTATAGRGGHVYDAGSSSDAGDGGTAAAAIALLDSGNVTATATANGGAGGVAIDGAAGDGGAASLGVNLVGVTGESTAGGAVTVTGTANGGDGGAATGTGDAGDGASVSLTDEVDGDTTGALTLTQNATGGNSGAVDTGANGTAGDAFSSLSRTSSSSSLYVDANATGGNGGERDAATGKAASGGSATSISTAINDAGEARANYSGSYDAQGGSGGIGRNGADGGDGGAASRTATATTQGDYYARTFGYARGGSGGYVTGATGGTAGAGGDAVDTTTVTSTGNGNIDGNSVGAYGGTGGYVNNGTGSGGAGGAAMATATGGNAGTASVTVGTTATGGNGGYGRGVGESGGAGGVATIVSATGSSTGGASVSVTANQTGGDGGAGYDGADGGDGADSDLVDVVTGSTSGSLTLNQTARGGAGGYNYSAVGGTAGRAGNATSSLTAGNSDGGNVTGNSTATGGTGGSVSGAGSISNARDGGAAAAAIALVDSGNVTATATANGGTGGAAIDGAAGDGGAASLGVNLVGVSGESTAGGAVSVTGTANGGDGGAASGTGDAGDGASVSLTDEVDGDTTGALTLTQTATGGNSGAVDTGANGTAGDAFSSLSRTSSSSSLYVDANAIGGNGGERDAATGKAASGGSATSISTAINDAGEARANYSGTYDATGGSGGIGRNGADGGDGGAASRTATATSQGDYYARSYGYAQGGSGGYLTGATGGTAGAGGDAVDTTTVTSTGNGNIDGNSVGAYGGDGGYVSSGTGSGGAGGAAMATATGSNAGTAGVTVGTTATGGDGGYGRGVGEFGGNGGNATASASGIGGGSISVRADADGGDAGSGLNGATAGLGGNGFATATGTGTSGTVIAEATVGTSVGKLVNDLIAYANGGVASTVNAKASAQLSGDGFSTAGASGQQATALAYGAPDDSVTLPNVLGNAVLANFDISGVSGPATVNNSGQLNSDVYGMGVLGGSYSADGSGATRTYTSSADFDVDTTLLSSGTQNLLVGLMNPVTTGTPFDDPDFAVRFRIFGDNNTSTPLVDQTFTDQASFDAFFSGNTLDLGATVTGDTDRDLKFQLDVTANDNPGAGVAVDYVVGNSTITQRAVPYLPNTDIAVGDHHVGDVVLQGIEVNNVAVAGSDGADAAFIASSGDATTNGGAITGLASGGGGDNSSMQVGIDTSTSGAKSGSVTVELTTDGSVTGNAEVFGSTVVSVDGAVYGYADPTIDNAPFSFGNVRVGDTAQDALSISNTAVDDGYSENLNASVEATSGGVSASGSFTGLGPQDTNDTDIIVGIDTSTAGNKTGTATIGLVSDGTGINSLGQTALASQVVDVSGNVFRLAEAGAHSPEPVVLADSHVGDVAQQALSMTNTALADGYSESLNALIGGDTGDVSSSGSFNLLGAQATDNSSLVVGIDTSTAGAKSGTATISSESDGAGTSDIVGNVALADQIVNVSGNVYRLAEASAHSPEPVNLGNVHVGDNASMALTLANNAVADGFSEALNAGFTGTTGDATSSGSISQLAAGASDSSSLLVGIDTSTAGAKSGTAALGLQSDGDGINSLGQTALSGQTVNVSGAVYRLAEATINNAPAFVFGNVHVGDTVAQTVSISNTSIADIYSEALNASFGAASDARITNNGGSVSLLAAGGTDAVSMTVGVNTAAAGVVSGTQTINFASDGTGTSGLGITALDSQDLTVTATIDAGVYRLANPVIDTAQPVAFGNVREGAVVAAQAISITNDVPDDGFSEALNAQAAGTTGGVLNNGGSFSLLAPGATNNTAIEVSIDTASAGDKSGTATIDFESDGTGSSGLGITQLPSQDVAVTGAVFRLAEGGTSPVPIDFVARVNDIVNQALTVTNTATSDGYSENLDASATSAGNASVSGGPIVALAAGASDNSSLSVSADTSTSGVSSGTVTVAYESNGQEWGLGANVDLGTQEIAVNTTVYAEAVADVTPAVDFGTVRKGSLAASSITVANTGTGALVDDLRQTSSSADAPFSVDPLTGDIAAGDSAVLGVGMDTSVAGIFSGVASLGFASHNDDLADVDLGTSTVAFTGTVNNLAEAIFVDVTDPDGDGTLLGGGTAFTLDFGTINLADIGLTMSDVLGVQNIAAGPAELLAGDFTSLACGVFCLSGFDPFTALAAGDILGGLMVNLDTQGLGVGLYQESIIFNPFSTWDQLQDIALDPITLTFSINVRDSGGQVPLPGTLLLILVGIPGLFYRRGRAAPAQTRANVS
ncbi:MAG: choice-of-anchor D domain-containing protein, partial [Halioglobus sp.]|nr:choice-of-anchor D domain-containing protein [Halioglobus sp.]